MNIKNILQERLFADSAKAVSLKLVAAVLAFSSIVVISRSLDLENLGAYFLAVSLVAIASIFCRVGLDNVVSKEIALSDFSETDTGIESDVYYAASSLVMINSVLVTSIIFIFSDTIAGVFDSVKMAELLDVMCFAVLPLSVISINTMSLRGLRKFELSILSHDILVPFLMLCSGSLLITTFSSKGVGYAYLLSTTIACLLSTWFWGPSLRHWSINRAIVSRLWLSSKHLFGASLINRGFLPFAPVLLLGFLSAASEVAIFGAVTRITNIVAIIIVAIGGVVSPAFSRLHNDGNLRELEALGKKSAKLTSLAVLPSCLLVGLAAKDFLQLFGSEFAVGSLSLQVLLIGRCLGASFGAQGQLLMMASQERWFKISSYLVAALLLILLYVFIRQFGSFGAALALAISYLVLALAHAYLVSSKVGVRSYAFGKFPVF